MRTLLLLSRALDEPIPQPPATPGVTIRPFRPGADEADWLALNSVAFAGYPDQSSWGPRELAERLGAEWFDPAGFLLAHDDSGTLIGCNWTKVHGCPPVLATGWHGPGRQATSPPTDEEAVGEIYVLAVAPAAQGRGLGRSLTLAGLAHLRALGLPRAMLYVDKANARAVRLYQDLGLVAIDDDVAFLANASPAPPGKVETAH